MQGELLCQHVVDVKLLWYRSKQVNWEQLLWGLILHLFWDCENKMAGASSYLKSMGKKIDNDEVMEIQYLLKDTVSGKLFDCLFMRF